MSKDAAFKVFASAVGAVLPIVLLVVVYSHNTRCLIVLNADQRGAAQTGAIQPGSVADRPTGMFSVELPAAASMAQ